MITAPQLRAARALLGIDQTELAERAQLSLPTIQRMETSGGLIRGNVDSLMRVIRALEDLGVEIIGEGSTSNLGGRGVRLREREIRLTQIGARPRPKSGRMTVNLGTRAPGVRGRSD
ncbi:MAG TPA: helix-turn-helix transcriptional regulator [Steroidobacteraceae bacterium]|nr:helix-turn-helix transcriptional regulator [Steroidobacteraceae bacterium]